LHEKVDGAIIGVETVKRITDKHKAVQTNETPYHIANNSAIGNERIDTPGRLTLPSKIGASTHARNSASVDSLNRDSYGGIADSSDIDTPGYSLNPQITSEHTPGPGALPSAADPFSGRSHGISSDQAISVSPSLGPESAQADFPPAGSAASGATTAQASGRIPKRPQLKSDPRDVQGRIDAYRGYALEEKVEIIRERQAVKTWCSLHDLSDFDLVLHYLTTQDKYWKLEENKHRIGGVTLAKETPKALAALERKGKPPDPPQGYADNDMSIMAQLWRQEHRERSAK